MDLYVDSVWSVLSTIFVFVVIVYYVVCRVKQNTITSWGKHCIVIVFLGLVLCCLVVMRDGYVDALLGGQGVFDPNSMQIYMAYGIAACIGITTCTLLFIRKQQYRKYLFSIISICILCKIIWIEVARLLL